MNKIYIYNPEQMKFYLNEGLELLEVGVHKKTNKTFWVFDKEKSNPIYTKWLKKCHLNSPM